MLSWKTVIRMEILATELVQKKSGTSLALDQE